MIIKECQPQAENLDYQKQIRNQGLCGLTKTSSVYMHYSQVTRSELDGKRTDNLSNRDDDNGGALLVSYISLVLSSWNSALFVSSDLLLTMIDTNNSFCSSQATDAMTT